MNHKNISLVRPSLPPIDELLPYLQHIWDSRILSNRGPLLHQLEDALCKELGVSHISLVNNGMTALTLALQCLDLKGEVITTPFSFLATAHAIRWNQLKPVFIDVEADNFNLDPALIEAAITPNTSAILAVHCYGHACHVEEIEAIAHKHGLKVIYDAAHAFGVTYQGQSLLNYGDVSILSLHATKVFNTFEGGAIICKNEETKRLIDKLQNFGIESDNTAFHTGLNGKMSELHAAVGLSQLSYWRKNIAARREVDTYYRQKLSAIKGITCLPNGREDEWNYGYFPIIVEDNYHIERDELFALLQKHGITTRRYFFPLITDMLLYGKIDSRTLPIAADAAEKILCLPIHPYLTTEEIDWVISVISGQLNG